MKHLPWQCMGQIRKFLVWMLVSKIPFPLLPEWVLYIRKLIRNSAEKRLTRNVVRYAIFSQTNTRLNSDFRTIHIVLQNVIQQKKPTWTICEIQRSFLQVFRFALKVACTQQRSFLVFLLHRNHRLWLKFAKIETDKKEKTEIHLVC